MGVRSYPWERKNSLQNRALARCCAVKHATELAHNPDTHAGFPDSITLLAPQWGSAVSPGRGNTRARIALSLGAVLSNTLVNWLSNPHTHAEFLDSIKGLAPQWGSAVTPGRGITRARIALSLGAVLSNTRLNLLYNSHTR